MGLTLRGLNVDDSLVKRFRGQLARGELILFTGAGFSLGLQTESGLKVLSVGELKQALWRIAFPRDDFDESSSLPDIYEIATRRGGNKVRDLLKDRTKIAKASVDAEYEVWFSAPWFRTYTLNVDDLDEVVQRRFSLPRSVQSISALAASLPPASDALLSIHLNGKVDEYPNLTFSTRHFGERTARADPWYAHLISDLVSHPILFVGTQLDEPPLRHYLEMRRRGSRAGKELRPGSYLVTPSLPAARRAVLETLNIDWLQMDRSTFCNEILEKSHAEREAGLRIVSAPRARIGTTPALQKVGEVRTSGPADLADYLLGREPSWRDVTEGFAIPRTFEEELGQQIAIQQPRLVVLTGTAGSGKSTTLKRIAVSMHAEGADARWLNLESGLSSWEFPRALTEAAPDVLCIDDVDVFGTSTRPMLDDFLESSKSLIVVTMGSSRYERLGMSEVAKKYSLLQYAIPNLEDADIESLLDSLDKANRLGKLKGMSHPQRVSEFRDRASRQLLVAMIEATSGEKFDEKIDRECRDLPSAQRLIYAVASVATSLRYGLSQDEILIAVADPTNETLNAIQSLINQRLLVSGERGLMARHRVVADRALEYFRQEGQLFDPIRGLIFAMASKVTPEARREPARRFLTRLLNHDWLKRLLLHDEARDVYADAETQLSWDYHLWLQRGSLEVESGDLELAENFLNQAHSLAPNDYKVQTEWAYMMLKKASQLGSTPESFERAGKAFQELESAISGRGSSDSYPYHVLGSQGLSWVRRAGLSQEETKRTLARLRSIVKEGARLHPGQADLKQLATDVEKEYLMLAVPPDKR